MESTAPAQLAEPTLILGLPVEVLALVVAGFGLFASLSALAWQFAKHVLDGGRVKAYLNVGIWEPDFAIRVNRSGRHILQDQEETSALFRDHFEVAQLVVENPGRTAVTVYSPGLAITGTSAKRHSLTPRSFDLGDGFATDNPSTESMVRLEPYDRVSFYYDYWSVVPGLLEKAGKRGITIRGFVSVAGRTNRPQKSSWRRRWRIPHGAYTAIEGSPQISPYTVLWRELWRSAPSDRERQDDGTFRITRGQIKFFLQQAMRKFETAPKREVLMEVLEKEALQAGDPYPVIHFGLLEGYRSMERLKDHLGLWSWVSEKTPEEEAVPTAPEGEGSSVPIPPTRRAARAHVARRSD